MVTTVAVTKAVSSIRDAHERFNLSRTTNEQFFDEWKTLSQPLSETEVTELHRLKDRYLYYMEGGEISEGTANIIMLSPLLNILGLCDPPYRVQGERWVRLSLETETDEGPVTLEGRIDALTLQGNLWLVVAEEKRGGFNVLQAIPQTLAYMMASPNQDKIAYGLVTNGYDYLFLKLDKATSPQYALSHNFTLLSDENNNLLRVAKVLKRLVWTVTKTRAI